MSEGNSKQSGITSHFDREAKFMIGFFLLVVVLGISLAIMGPWLFRQVEIDSCLDGGGSYNYETDKCRYETTDTENSQ